MELWIEFINPNKPFNEQKLLRALTDVSSSAGVHFEQYPYTNMFAVYATRIGTSPMRSEDSPLTICVRNGCCRVCGGLQRPTDLQLAVTERKSHQQFKPDDAVAFALVELLVID